MLSGLADDRVLTEHGLMAPEVQLGIPIAAVPVFNARWQVR